jgi:hypothetical protein
MNFISGICNGVRCALFGKPKNYCKETEYKTEDLLLICKIKTKRGTDTHILTIKINGDKTFKFIDATNEYLNKYIEDDEDFPDKKKLSTISRCSDKNIMELILAVSRYSCQNTVETNYIEDQSNKYETKILLFDMSDKGGLTFLKEFGGDSWMNKMITKVGKPIGFIVGFTKERNELNQKCREAYIDVVCSCPGGGRYMIQYFINWANENKYTAVSLSSLPQVLAYYPKTFKFEHRHDCEESADIVEIPKELYDKKYINKDPAKGKIYNSIEDYYDDNIFSEHMINLQEKGYGNVKEKICNGKGDKKNLKKGKCGKNGYVMRLCLNK